jgi:hypothetical protein
LFLASPSNDPIDSFNQPADALIAHSLSVGSFAHRDHQMFVKLSYFTNLVILFRTTRRDLRRMVKRGFNST